MILQNLAPGPRHGDTIRTTLENLTSNLPDRLVAAGQSNPVQRQWAKALSRKHRKHTIRYMLLAANLLMLVVVTGFVVRGSGSSQPIRQSAASVNGSNVSQENPLDPLSSADIAVHVARMTRLPETTAVVNEADSASVMLSVASTDEKVISKPQIVPTALKSIKDLQTYITQAGDTVSNVASKFGITSDSVRWSNSLTGDTLPVGKELWIPPQNGIVYVVKAGDTPDSIATRYRANKDQIIAFNDAEVSGLTVGKRIVIPEGTVAATASATPFVFFGLGSGGYDRGWCTDYASVKGGVPGGWGNANTWDNYAILSGWTVSKVPVVGAVAQTDAGSQGHVGIVDAVSDDGTMIKYSDMNGLAGFNRVGYSDWVPVHSKFQNFIYH